MEERIVDRARGRVAPFPYGKPDPARWEWPFTRVTISNTPRVAVGRLTARRGQIRLSVQGLVWRRGLLKIEYEFAGTEVEFKDFFIGITELGPLGTVKLGYFKEPFSLEQQTSRLFLTFMERSLMNVFSPRRNSRAHGDQHVLRPTFPMGARGILRRRLAQRAGCALEWFRR